VQVSTRPEEAGSARCLPLIRPLATMPKCVKAADADANADDVENDDDADNNEHNTKACDSFTTHAIIKHSQTTMGQNTPPHAHTAYQCPLAAFTLLRSS